MPEGEDLATGTSVKLYIISEKAENVMVLPTDTLYYENGESFVYVYEEGTVHKKMVETGVQDETKVEIVSGIAQDDQVITTWSPELYEGAVVELAEGGSDGSGRSCGRGNQDSRGNRDSRGNKS